ncbi:MAG: 30S ribosomal protein S8e [Nanoarchaeota archaeon]|nr:30S ribosomal protein S8e [Nanoarchaeota archaeon]
MAISHLRSGIKPTGGKLNKSRKKKKRDFGSDFIAIKIGTERRKVLQTLGDNYKSRILEVESVNVIKDGKTYRTKILEVLENKANPNFVRMNIITKGCIINTELGKAKITSRPGQHGIMNGVLIK